MHRRSLVFLLVALVLLGGLTFWLLRAGDGPAVIAHPEEETGANDMPGEPAAPIEATAPSTSQEAPRRAPGAGVGTPHAPERRALAPDECRVAGWLHPDEDRAWRDAFVALVRRGDDPTPTALVEGRVEPDGGFVLSLHDAPARTSLLVEARGYRPRLVDVELHLGREVLLEDLELDRGAAIAGRVTSNARPLARFEVVAVDARDLPRLVLGGGELLWTGSVFDWRFTTGESDEGGHYAIRGLREGEYGVRVSTCRGPLSSLCTGDRVPRSVEAPSAEVDFGFESSQLALSFTHAGQPLAGVDVELASGGWRSGKRCDAAGACTFELVPRMDCDLVATKKGYRPLRLPVSSPASGGHAEQSFELEVEPPAPAVRFCVGAAAGEETDALRVLLFAAGDPTSGAPAQVRLLATAAGGAKGSSREFLFEQAPPGRWTAVLIPGFGFTGSFAPENYVGTHCLVQTDLTIPAQGEVRCELVAQRRPALRLDLHDAAGIYPSGRCTLRSPENGAELPAVLVDPRHGAALGTRALAVDGPTLLYTTLCAGRALLTVDRDGETILQQNVEFLPGEITPITRGR